MRVVKIKTSEKKPTIGFHFIQKDIGLFEEKLILKSD